MGLTYFSAAADLGGFPLSHTPAQMCTGVFSTRGRQPAAG